MAISIGPGAFDPSNMPGNTVSMPASLTDCLLWRLFGTNRFSHTSFEDKSRTNFRTIVAEQCTDNQYVVFLVTADGKPLMLEDNELFPSDALITRLRLLIK